jgi:hypothetical protein
MGSSNCGIQPAMPSSNAIHEAGHAVLALYCRLQVNRVTILREGDAAGACLVRLSCAAAIIAAAVMIAGYLAVKIADRYASSSSASSDFIAAAMLLPPGTDSEDLVFKVRRRLYSLWDEIVRAAEALDRDGELVGVDHIRRVARLTSWLS